MQVNSELMLFILRLQAETEDYFLSLFYFNLVYKEKLRSRCIHRYCQMSYQDKAASAEVRSFKRFITYSECRMLPRNGDS